MVEQIVLTSLDWVMDAEGAFLTRLKPALASLKEKHVAVVGFTGSDRAQIEPVRAELNWHDPFITESGSAIFTPASHSPFSMPLGEQDGDYFVAELGCPYVQARAGLRVLANLISHPLKGFGDFTVPQLKKFLKVSEVVAHRAKAREFSEPFMTPKAVEPEVLLNAASDMGFGVVLRDPKENRFSDLVGREASVPGAISRVVEAYQGENSLRENALATVTVIGTKKDLQLVLTDRETSDWRSIEMPSATPRFYEQWLAAIESCCTAGS